MGPKASAALVFGVGLLLRPGGAVGERLERDGEGHGRDQVRRTQPKVAGVAAGPKSPRLHLKIKKLLK